MWGPAFMYSVLFLMSFCLPIAKTRSLQNSRADTGVCPYSWVQSIRPFYSLSLPFKPFSPLGKILLLIHPTRDGAGIVAFTFAGEGGDELHLVFYLALALAHVGTGLLTAETTRIGKRGIY